MRSNVEGLFDLRSLGITEIHAPKTGGGSSDIGNVSYVTPTIHPYISISNCEIRGHSRELAKATTESLGHERLLTAVLALAASCATGSNSAFVA